MSYIALSLNHFRAIQLWAQETGAEATLNARTFELEVKVRSRYYKLRPQFLNKTAGRLSHSPLLTQDSIGFIGWLPYPPQRWDLASDKLVFKQFLGECGERTPAAWENLSAANADHVLKRSAGSFGYELAGPFKAEQLHSAVQSQHAAQFAAAGVQGVPYAEQFILGRNFKVWFWGERAFYIQSHDYPEVTGDGARTVRALVAQRLAHMGLKLDENPDASTLKAALDYQHVSLNQVMPQGQRIWLDYRYGRHYANEPRSSSSDNDLSAATPALLEQITRIGAKLAAKLQQQFPAPRLYSLDGVLDGVGRMWWLEMNSNPILPPEAYPHIFETLFGIPARAAEQRVDPPSMNALKTTPLAAPELANEIAPLQSLPEAA